MVTQLATFVFLYSSIRSSALGWSECRPKHVGDHYAKKKNSVSTEVHLLVIYIYFGIRLMRRRWNVLKWYITVVLSKVLYIHIHNTMYSLHNSLPSFWPTLTVGPCTVHDNLQIVPTKLWRINKHTTLHILNKTNTTIPQFFTEKNITVKF